MKLVSNAKYPQVIGVRNAQIVSGYNVHVTFTDGTERDIDLEPLLWGPVFAPIRSDPAVFASIFVDPIGQTLAWPGGVDLAPESLYYGDKPPPWARESSAPKHRPAQIRGATSASRVKPRRHVRGASARRAS
ncbi:MAG: DUF2442 domain-containing protein [Chloroflexi bacterium]|nr:DUF2442 domain-containing protein [Chloroflexota bacterium]